MRCNRRFVKWYFIVSVAAFLVLLWLLYNSDATAFHSGQLEAYYRAHDGHGPENIGNSGLFGDGKNAELIITDANVIVVEEHHEVVPYWIGAAEIGLIPKSGNILFHIDGHGDTAPPKVVSNMPLFRWPRNALEVKTMMQHNDEFIVAASLTDLIDRFIWIWPSWDLEAGNTFADYESFAVQMGYGTLPGTHDRTKRELCGCAFAIEGKLKYSDCVMRNTTDPESHDILNINPHQCKIAKHGLVEIVKDEEAMRRSLLGEWFKDAEEIILDIDEDYFGCDSSVVPLFDIGLDQNELDIISQSTSDIICARTTSQENEANSFLVSILRLVKTYLDTKCKHIGAKREGVICPELWNHTSEMVQVTLKNRTKASIFCTHKEIELIPIVLDFLQSVFPMNSKQISALMETGFCFDIIPQSFHFHEQQNFRICQGHNSPNATAVYFHTPNRREIVERSKNMKEMLTNLRVQPKLVTVCRSVRDGYTPKKYVHQIEGEILKVVNQISSSYKVHYDANLFGGKMGWMGRDGVSQETREESLAIT